MGRRCSDKVVSREVILRAATSVFMESGFDGARMDTIARAGRFNKAMIYYHFKDKQAIYEEVIRSVVMTIVDKIRIYSENPSSIEQLVGMMYDTYYNLALERSDYMRLTVSEFVRGGSVIKRMKLMRWQDIPVNPVSGPVFTFLKEKMRQGEIRRMDPWHLMLNIIGLIIPSLLMVFVRDILKDIRHPASLTALIDDLFKSRRAEVIETVVLSIRPQSKLV